MKKIVILQPYLPITATSSQRPLSSVPINPLSPKSDQPQISPYNISALLNRVVMRITDMITQDEFA